MQTATKPTGKGAKRSRRAISQAYGQSVGASHDPWWRSQWLLCAILLLLVFSLYGQVVGHPFITYDDPGYVAQNAHVREGLTWQTFRWSFTTFEEANWHPLTWLSHALDCEWFGVSAGAHHLTNVLFHTLNAVLLFLLLHRATKEPMLSFLVAALFAVHPFHVESVAWVSERKNVLSTFFFLLTLGAYGWYVHRPSWKKYLIVVMTFICGLASKPMLVTLPAVLLLLDYWPLDRIAGWTPPSNLLSVPQRRPYQLILEKIPLFLLSVGSSAVTLVAQKTGEALVPFSIAVKFKTALAGYALYLLKAVWPSGFALYYPDPFDPHLNQHASSGDYLLVAAGVVLIVVISLVAWRYRRERPYFLVGWLWYVGTLVPVIGLVKAGPQLIADRYAYIPLIGIFVSIVWGAAEIARAYRVDTRWRVGGSIAILTALFVIAFLQVRYWRSSFDIFFHTLNVTRNNVVANDKIAVLFLQQGRPDDALHYYFEAARIAPWDAASHEAVAAWLDEQGRYQDALQAYDVVLRNSKDPDALALAYSNIGVIHSRMGEYPQGRVDAQEAARIDSARVAAQISGLANYYSQNPTAQGYIKLSLLLDNAGRLDQARVACRKAADLDPNSVEVRKVLDHLERE